MLESIEAGAALQHPIPSSITPINFRQRDQRICSSLGFSNTDRLHEPTITLKIGTVIQARLS